MSTTILAFAWIGIAAAGLAVNLFAVGDAKIDRYYAQHHLHKGTRLLVAQSNIRRERTRVMVQVAFLAAGVLSLMHPAAERLEGTRVWLGLAMVVASLLTVFNSFADRSDRKKLLKLIEEQEDHSDRNFEHRVRAQEAMEKRHQARTDSEEE